MLFYRKILEKNIITSKNTNKNSKITKITNNSKNHQSCGFQESPQLSNQINSTSVHKALGNGNADVAPIKQQPSECVLMKLPREANSFETSTNIDSVNTPHNQFNLHNTPTQHSPQEMERLIDIPITFQALDDAASPPLLKIGQKMTKKMMDYIAKISDELSDTVRHFLIFNFF